MPPKKTSNHRNIRDFFKPYAIPKSRIAPDNDSEDEIIVAQPGRQPAKNTLDSREPATCDSTEKRERHSSDLSSSATSSPATCTPKKTHRRPTSASPLSSSANNDLYHSSPSSATQRKMSAVAIPSSTPPRRSPSPVTAPKPRVPLAQPTRSFSSFSTLSSIPQSSGSSRRVMRDGLQAVTNSDSDSDSMDELADLDSFLPRKKMKMTPPPGKDGSHAIQPASLNEMRTRESDRLSVDRGSNISRSTKPQLPKSPPKPTYKFSLAKMAADARKRQKAETRIAEAEAAIQAAERLREEEAASADSLAHLDVAKLTEMFDAEEDENQRTVLALARTEALERQETFAYFKTQPRKARDASFPSRSLPKASWAEGLDDMETREQACLSGFLADLASCNMLNASIITWFAQQLIHEPREELCEAYMEIIRAATEHADQVDGKLLSSLQSFYWTTIVTEADQLTDDKAPPAADHVPMSSELSAPPEDVVSCICGLDEDRGRAIACDDCDTWQHSTCYYPQYDGKEMPKNFEHQCVACKPRYIDKAAAQRRQNRPVAEHEADPDNTARPPDRAPGLPHVAKVLQYCAPLAGAGAIGQAICDLALANNDDFVRFKVGLRQALSEATEVLCDALQPDEVDTLYKYARKTLLTEEKLSLNMQARLISSLPATSTQTHVFRRRLALYLMTNSQKLRPLTSPEWVDIIIKRLKTAPEFAMGDKSDYNLVLNLTTILDIAIDAGFSDFAFFDNVDAQPVEIGPFGKSKPKVSAEETAFNKNVDLLSEQIKEMASRITGAGATHVKRVEAKSALERVCLRLEYGVRTRPRPRKGVFGELDSERRGRVSMEGFLKMMPKYEDSMGLDAADTREPMHELELPERPSPVKKRVSIMDPDAEGDDSFHMAVEEKDEVGSSDCELSDQADEEGSTAQDAKESASGAESGHVTPRDALPKSSWDFGRSCVRF